jgi:hypothetical protein
VVVKQSGQARLTAIFSSFIFISLFLAIFTHRFLLNKKSIFPGKKQSVSADKKISKFVFCDELNPSRPVTKISGFKRMSVRVHRNTPVKQ